MDIKYKSAKPFLPSKLSLEAIRKAARHCQGCDLYKNATHTVFGEGPRKAKVLFIGEQPGDQEDQKGLPFVGQAGKLLDRALIDAGISRDETYVTNAVKHFKWIRKGKRRIHQRPGVGEIKACAPWLEAEVKLIKPIVIVCLGATASRAIFGHNIKISDYRSNFHVTDWSKNTFVTVHPSAILRITDESDRHKEYQLFVKDLKKILSRLK